MSNERIAKVLAGQQPSTTCSPFQDNAKSRTEGNPGGVVPVNRITVSAKDRMGIVARQLKALHESLGYDVRFMCGIVQSTSPERWFFTDRTVDTSTKCAGDRAMGRGQRESIQLLYLTTSISVYPQIACFAGLRQDIRSRQYADGQDSWVDSRQNKRTSRSAVDSS